MSQQFVFWKTDRQLDARAVYEALMDGQSVPGLEVLDASTGERAIIAAFPDWAVGATRADGGEQTALEAPDQHRAVMVDYLPQAVTASCYGMGPDDWNRVISAFVDLGWPLYDPQIDARFDEY